jgi:uncharacterized protein
VLWSRLGDYERDELHRLLYEERTLVDYWVHIVSARELPLHVPSMRRYPRGHAARARYLRAWLRDNARFRRYVLREIERRCPLRSRDLEDRAVVPWRTGGWNDGKSLGRMLDALWFGAKIAVVGRLGRERIWDLASRHSAYEQPKLPAPVIARRIVASQLLGLGVAGPAELGVAFDGPIPGAGRAVAELVETGEAVPVTIRGHGGSWLASRRLFEGEYTPRSTLLSAVRQSDRGSQPRRVSLRLLFLARDLPAGQASSPWLLRDAPVAWRPANRACGCSTQPKPRWGGNR